MILQFHIELGFDMLMKELASFSPARNQNRNDDPDERARQETYAGVMQEGKVHCALLSR